MIPTKPMLIALGALAACATHEVAGPDYAPADPSAVDANLARLAALDVFVVGDLVVQEPASAYNCYGPCPGYEADLAAAEQQAAERLAALVEVAEVAAAGSPPGDACDASVIEANLAALRALGIVDVGELIVEEPENDAMCYNLPCPEDIEAAEAVTCRRAGALAGIAQAAKDL